jgi:hypothetical protein
MFTRVPNPGPWVAFLNMRFIYRKELAPHPNSKMEDQSSSAGSDWPFSIFLFTLYIRRQSVSIGNLSTSMYQRNLCSNPQYEEA